MRTIIVVYIVYCQQAPWGCVCLNESLNSCLDYAELDHRPQCLHSPNKVHGGSTCIQCAYSGVVEELVYVHYHMEHRIITCIWFEWQ